MANLIFFQHNTILQHFQKVFPGIEETAKYQLVISVAPLEDAVKRNFLSTKIDDLHEISNPIEHLDAHYVFLPMHNCFSMPRLLYFLRTSTCFAEKGLLKQNDDVLKKL